MFRVLIGLVPRRPVGRLRSLSAIDAFLLLLLLPCPRLPSRAVLHYSSCNFPGTYLLGYQLRRMPGATYSADLQPCFTSPGTAQVTLGYNLPVGLLK